MYPRHLLWLVALLMAPTLSDAGEPEPLTRIAFGSCVHQDKPQPIWKAVNADEPELFIFMGDNIYGDSRDINELREKYQKLSENPGFQTLRHQSDVIATWDDHDYGENDAGKNYPLKEASRQLMLDFWREPADTERRTRDSGLYTSYLYGPPGQRVQVLLLDLRWNRTALNSVSRKVYENARKPNNQGPYSPTEGADAVLLGEAQWRWLEAQLKEPADLRLLVSSLQLLPEFTGWESWANFPDARQRLFDLIREQSVENLVILSGDTHWAELSRLDGAAPYPLWEVTSSGLTEEWKAVSPNRHRIGSATHRNNYGSIQIDWQAPSPQMTLSIKDQNGQHLLQQHLRLSDLRSRP